MLPEDEGKG